MVKLLRQPASNFVFKAIIVKPLQQLDPFTLIALFPAGLFLIFATLTLVTRDTVYLYLAVPLFVVALAFGLMGHFRRSPGE